ncbi:MAG: FprA family A-type flavoprotein [Bacilli bacterium]|nr:FprA family A-type flavoprotein [Bacilli bacterium]
MKIIDNIHYIGVNDYDLDLFEGQYPLPNGMAYNSYVIIDEKIAVMDTVDFNFHNEWLNNLEAVLNNRLPDYLVIHHMEPDHSASLKVFLTKYPKTIVVGNKKVLQMIGQFFPKLNIEDRFMEVKEAETLNLGSNLLTFYFAPMVHWPEVMLTYEGKNKVLFSADAFGKFGALDYEEEWVNEARRYYIGIIGKYGKQVQNILKKVSVLEIDYICSLHGPVLKDNIDYHIDLYNKWANYESEASGVTIAYCSMYGNTKEAAMLLYKKLKEENQEVAIFDLARSDVFGAIASAFKYDKLVLASPTYNTAVLPFMDNFINGLVSRNYSGRKIGIIENGSWAITAAKKMKEAFLNSSNIEFLEPIVSIRSSIAEVNLDEIEQLKLALLK